MNLVQRYFYGLIGTELVRVVYSDESGTGDSAQPISVVTAILLNADSQWEPIERELSVIKATIPRKLLGGINNKPSPYVHIDREEFEFKGSVLFKGIRGKLRGVTPNEAKEALVKILGVARKNGAQIFHGAIDRAGRENWKRDSDFSEALQTDEEAAFTECLQRMDAFVHTFMSKERILWIADKSGYEASLKHGLQFFQLFAQIDTDALRQFVARLRRNNLNGLIDGVSVDEEEKIVSHVVDTIYFGHSHESLALQLADVCCATITQYLMGNDDAGPFYNFIRQSVVTDGTPIVYSKAWARK
jgi:uncharacterized protein DUF3800